MYIFIILSLITGFTESTKAALAGNLNFSKENSWVMEAKPKECKATFCLKDELEAIEYTCKKKNQKCPVLIRTNFSLSSICPSLKDETLLKCVEHPWPDYFPETTVDCVFSYKVTPGNAEIVFRKLYKESLLPDFVLNFFIEKGTIKHFKPTPVLRSVAAIIGANIPNLIVKNFSINRNLNGIRQLRGNIIDFLQAHPQPEEPFAENPFYSLPASEIKSLATAPQFDLANNVFKEVTEMDQLANGNTLPSNDVTPFTAAPLAAVPGDIVYENSDDENVVYEDAIAENTEWVDADPVEEPKVAEAPVRPTNIDLSLLELTQDPKFLIKKLWLTRKKAPFYTTAFYSEATKQLIDITANSQDPSRPVFITSSIEISSIFPELVEFWKNAGLVTCELSGHIPVSVNDKTLNVRCFHYCPVIKPGAEAESILQFFSEFNKLSLIPSHVVDFFVDAGTVQEFRSDKQEITKEVDDFYEI